MSEIFIGSKEHIREVESWADDIYATLPELLHIPLEYRPQVPYCYEISYELLKRARTRGFDADILESDLGHVHVDLGNGWGADASWKQFLASSKRTQAPNIIVAPLSDFPSILAGYGVINLDYWIKAVPALLPK